MKNTDCTRIIIYICMYMICITPQYADMYKYMIWIDMVTVWYWMRWNRYWHSWYNLDIQCTHRKYHYLYYLIIYIYILFISTSLLGTVYHLAMQHWAIIACGNTGYFWYSSFGRSSCCTSFQSLGLCSKHVSSKEPWKRSASVLVVSRSVETKLGCTKPQESWDQRIHTSMTLWILTINEQNIIYSKKKYKKRTINSDDLKRLNKHRQPGLPKSEQIKPFQKDKDGS